MTSGFSIRNDNDSWDVEKNLGLSGMILSKSYDNIIQSGRGERITVRDGRKSLSIGLESLKNKKIKKFVRFSSFASL